MDYAKRGRGAVRQVNGPWEKMLTVYESFHGDDYGWPWVYQTESFRTKAVAIKGFDRFEWTFFIGDVIVGLVILVGIEVIAESAIR
jgi:hypothetical protein